MFSMDPLPNPLNTIVDEVSTRRPPRETRLLMVSMDSGDGVVDSGLGVLDSQLSISNRTMHSNPPNEYLTIR